jgi:hypothetical protein
MRRVFKRDAVRLPGDRTCNRHTYHATALKRHYNGVAKTGIGYFTTRTQGASKIEPRRHFRLQIFFPKGFADSEFCFLICVTEQTHSYSLQRFRNPETSKHL